MIHLNEFSYTIRIKYVLLLYGFSDVEALDKKNLTKDENKL